MKNHIKHIIFDWGDTLMVDDASRSDAMYLWPEVHAIEGAVDTLKKLSGKYTISVATSAAQSDEIMVRKALERVSLDAYISHVYTGKTLGRKKNELEFWTSIQAKLSADTKEIIVIGDSFEGDVITPTLAGFYAIWFNPSSDEKKTGERYQTVHKLAQITE